MSLNFLGYITNTGSGNATALNEKIIYLAEPIGTGILAIGDDLNFVKLTGAQNIQGVKNFKDNLIIDKPEGGIIMPNGFFATAVEGRGYLSGNMALNLKAGTNSIVLEKEDGNYTHIQAERVYLVSNDIIMSSRPKVNGTGILLSGDISLQSLNYSGALAVPNNSDGLENKLLLKEIFPYPSNYLPYRPINERYESIIYPEYYEDQYGRSGYSFFLGDKHPHSDRKYYFNDGGDWQIVYDTGYYGHNNRWIILNEEFMPSFRVAYVANGESNFPQYNSWSGLRTQGTGNSLSIGYSSNKLQIASKINFLDFDASNKTFLETVTFKRDIILSGAYPVQNSGASLGLEMSNGIYFDNFYKSPYIKYYAGYDNTLEIRNPGGSPGILKIINGSETVSDEIAQSITLDGDDGSAVYNAFTHEFRSPQENGEGGQILAGKFNSPNIHIRRYNHPYPYGRDGSGILFHNLWSNPFGPEQPGYAARIYTQYDGEEFVISGKSGTPSLIRITNGPTSYNHETISIDNDDHSISLAAQNINFSSKPTVNGTGILLSGEASTLPNTIVYTTGNQAISGNKIFENSVHLTNLAKVDGDILKNTDGYSSLYGTEGVKISAYGSGAHDGNAFLNIDRDDSSFIIQSFSNNPIHVNTKSAIFNNNIEVQGTGIFKAVDLSNISEFKFSGVSISLADSIVSGALNITGVRPTVNGTGFLLSGEAPSSQEFNTVINSIGNAILDSKQSIFETLGYVGNNFDGFTRVSPPLSKNSSGIVGQYTFSTGYFYLCTSPNLWARIPLDYNW